MSDVAVLLALLAAVAGAAVLVARSPGRGLGLRLAAGATGLIVATVAVVITVGMVRLGARQPTPEAPSLARVQPDLQRGERLAHLCAECHAEDGALPLSGGSRNVSPPLGRLYAPNLTPAGRIATWTDDQLVAAIRHGVDAQGRPLLLMPSAAYAGLSDADVAALVAFLRAQPAVANDVPPRHLNALGAAVVGLGVFPTSAARARAARPEATDSPGAYVATLAGCADCHGADLNGGDPRGFVPAGPGLGHVGRGWSAEAFATFFRTGTTPDGRAIADDEMPWRTVGRAFTDRELSELHDHLRASTGRDPVQIDTLGARVYAERCSGCHGDDGRGPRGPSLARNRRVADTSYLIDRILTGGRGMPAWSAVLDDVEIAAVATHVRTTWGNDHGPVDDATVARERGHRD